jgi:polyisoprenoid-binding protein YceI
MLTGMALAPGTHRLGPDEGRLEVHTFREGVAQRVGHDLIIEVTGWQALVDVGGDGAIASVGFEADPNSLEVREGLRGAKPLNDGDREDIKQTIEKKLLGGAPINFRASSLSPGSGRVAVAGDLTLAGTTRQVAFDLAIGDDGRVTTTVPVTQTDFGIKPYRAFMGALKVRDDVELALDARLPAA